MIISAGAYNLRGLTDSDDLYDLLRQVYMNALNKTYIFPIVAAGVALLTTFAVEHKNIKKVEKQREEARTEAATTTDPELKESNI